MTKLIDITDSEQSELALEFAESIHAGFPSPAADHTGERINLAREMTPHPETTFYAHVEGDSMRDVGTIGHQQAAVGVCGYYRRSITGETG